MTNSSIFTRVFALALCVLMFAGILTACFQNTESNPEISTQSPTNSTVGTTTTGGQVENEPNEDPTPVDPNQIFSGSTPLANDALIYGTLANDVFIGGEEGVAAIIPADVKVEAGASSLSLSVKKVEDENLADALSNLDVHISGVAADNLVPMTVKLGAILPIGLSQTELKLYHIENDTPVLMTRVASARDFAIHNQYVYNEETGDVTIYVASFSEFVAVQSTASEWEDNTEADTSWYNENETEFTLKDVADFLGFRNLVDSGVTFAEKTVTLATDIDLAGKLFNPIGYGYADNGGQAFMGTFDGGNHTIYNLYQNGWELGYSYSTAGGGLFASVKNATIKNLAINGANIVMECIDMGTVVGYAQGKCTFENIIVTNSKLANYQRYTGGVVGEVCKGDGIEDTYTHTFTNITVDSSVKISSLWGDFDNACGGVIGGKWGTARVLMQNVIVAAEIDAFSDVTAAYQWYAYRRCGMLIGHTEQNSPKKALNAAADFLTCVNVNVYYGDWVNYNYYQFTNQSGENSEGKDVTWQNNYPWVRAEAGEHTGAFSNVRYGNPIIDGQKINTLELAEANHTGFVTITFNQLYGGGQGVYGTNDHEGKGVTIHNKLTKTFYIENNLDWQNLKLYYWFQNGNDTWTTIVDGIDLTEENGVYKVNVPAYAFAFKITADGENETREFYLSEVEENGTYTLDFEHVHNFRANRCDCGAAKQELEYQFTFGEDGEAKHSDGSGASEYTETVDDYTLTLSIISSVYHNARDEMGNSCIKLGTSSAVGKFSFTVPEDVVKVIIYVAGREDKDAKVSVNGVEYEITTHSDDGEYTAIIVDTSENKTVSFTTVSLNGEERCMINTISYVTTRVVENHTCSFSEATCTTKATCSICGATTGEFADHNWNDATCEAPKTCDVCGETEGEMLPHTDNDPADHICDICNAENVSEHNYTDGYCSICGAKEPADYSGEYYIAAIRSSGNYFYMTSDLGTASTQRYQAMDSGLTELPSLITSGENDRIFVLEKNEDGTYYIYTKGVDSNNYLGWTSGNSGALVSKSDAKKFTITINDNGTFNIKFDSRYLSLNGTSGNDYFAFYTGTQKQDLTLIPVKTCEHTSRTNETIAPTCTEDGYTVEKCSTCGKEMSRTNEIPATGEHTYENGSCTGCGAEDPNAGGSTEPTPDPETPTEPTWTLTDIANIKSTDIVIIVLTTNNGTHYAISNDKGTSAAPTAVIVTLSGKADDNIMWNISNDNGNLTIYPNGTTAKWLYCTSTNNGVRVGTNTDKTFAIDATSGYLKHTGTNRYVGVYTTNPDVRCYTSTGTNINEQTLAFYVYNSGSEGGETPSCEHTNATNEITKEATCMEKGIRTYTCGCGETWTEEIAKNSDNHVKTTGTCDCGVVLGGSSEPATLAKFELGANGSATHSDGSEKTSYSETVNGYTLNITGGSKMYTGARDAKGNSALKLGTGSVAGKFTFTVPENVTSVVIYIAKYKTNTSKVTINGTTYTLTNNSNDGAYDIITIDTSSTKTVSLTTVSGGYRAMVNSIEFIGIAN